METAADPLELGEWALGEAFAFLGAASLARACCVSRAWREMGQQRSQWAKHWVRTKRPKK